VSSLEPADKSHDPKNYLRLKRAEGYPNATSIMQKAPDKIGGLLHYGKLIFEKSKPLSITGSPAGFAPNL